MNHRKEDKTSLNRTDNSFHKTSRFISLLTVILFTWTSILPQPLALAQIVDFRASQEVPAISKDPFPFALPQEIGLLNDYYLPDLVGDQKFVIHIQDAHAN